MDRVRANLRASGALCHETTITADGEPAPMAYSSERPATAAEIETEQARRAEAAERSRRMEAFRARPEW
jgi:hypothetical protein